MIVKSNTRIASTLGTLALITVTFISKFVGLLRELLLLNEIGLTTNLDAFVILFSVTTVVAGIAGSVVFTNVAPLARKLDSETDQLRLLLQGVQLGAAAFVVTLLLNTAISYFSLVSSSNLTFFFLLPFIVSLVSFFTIFGEFQASIFVAWGRNTPVIFGNLIVSVPLILLLMVSDLNIIAYALGLVTSFAVRSLVWFLIAKFKVLHFRKVWSSEKILKTSWHQAWSALVGSSAMTSLQLALLVLLLTSQSLGEGVASSFSYGFRLPYLLITTVWFVYGLKFFSSIIDQGLINVGTKIFKMTILNSVAASLLSSFCALYLFVFPNLNEDSVFKNPDYHTFVYLSFWALPICLFYPIVEMAQRTLVVAKKPNQVGKISSSVLVSSLLSSLAILLGYLNSAEKLLVCLSLTSGLAALVSLCQLYALAQCRRTN